MYLCWYIKQTLAKLRKKKSLKIISWRSLRILVFLEIERKQKTGRSFIWPSFFFYFYLYSEDATRIHFSCVFLIINNQNNIPGICRRTRIWTWWVTYYWLIELRNLNDLWLDINNNKRVWLLDSPAEPSRSQATWLAIW